MKLSPATEETKGLEAALYAASRNLKAFPRHANGLTPDSVKALPEYKAAKAEANRAFSALQSHNLSRKT